MPRAQSCISAVSSRSSNSPHSHKPKSFPGYYCVGWIGSAHGIRGELFVRLFAGASDWRDDAEQIFLLPKNQNELHAFTVKSLKVHKNGLIASFEEVKDRNRAEELDKAAVYILEEILQSDDENSIYLHQIQDFDLLNPDGEVQGKIVGFATNGVQDLLRVLPVAGGTEALVPFVEDFLVDIDFDKKQVTMDLPPGLIHLEDE